jgi:uncharacterized OB-fold protein
VPAFAEKLPLLTALVALAEDPAVRVVTNLVDCEPEALRAELPVRAVFRLLVFPNLPRRVMAPMFTPAP